jgi:hypothetical protein
MSISAHSMTRRLPPRPRVGMVALFLLVLGASVGSAETAASSRPSQTSAPRSQGDYAVLSQRNIFLSTRRKPRPTMPPTSRPAPPPLDPAADWVLRGVFARKGQCVAMMENGSSAQTSVVTRGETVFGRKIAEITLDGIRLDQESGADLWIRVGQTMNGSGSTPPKATVMAPVGSGPASPTAPESGDAMSILERLRQRRQQEGSGR